MKYFFLFLLSAASLGACKKDPNNQPSQTALLTSKKWRLTAQTSTYKARGGGITADNITDVYAGIPACEKDNYDEYYADNTTVIDEGVTKCVASSPQRRSSSWAFNTDQTKILFTPGATYNNNYIDIIELSATTLHLRKIDTSTGGNTTYTFTDDLIFTAF